MSEDTYQIRGDEVLAPGTLLAGRYEIVEFLAEGGMGRVYIALQRPIARKVALKVMRRELVFDNSSKKRFLREALAVSKLTHPNTITIIDYGDQEELCFIAMEFLDGMSLDRLLREGPMPLQRAVNIVGQIARSLSEAHRKGVIHRDLKPENIFVCEVDGNPDFVKVLDFGIARIQLEEGGGGVTRITREGYVCGTPEYMSPEQARGDEVDGRTDIYALGVMFWEMLEGEVPYDAPTPLGTVLKHQSDPVPPLSRRDLPEAIKQFVYRTMSKKREDRPDSAEAFLDELLLACPDEMGVGDEEFGRVSGRRRSITPQTPAMPLRRTDASMEEVAMAPTQTMPLSYDDAEPSKPSTPDIATEVPPPPLDNGNSGSSHQGLWVAFLAFGSVLALATVLLMFLLPISKPDNVPEPPQTEEPVKVVEAPKPVQTRLVIAGMPLEAKIYNGDTLLGGSPVLLEGNPGDKVVLTVRKQGFVPQTLEGQYPAEGEDTLRFTMKPETRLVEVTSEPLGATVQHGDKALGVTPLKVELTPGKPLELRLALESYRDATLTLNDTTGSTQRVALELVEQPTANRPKHTRRSPATLSKNKAKTPKDKVVQDKPKTQDKPPTKPPVAKDPKTTKKSKYELVQ